jgi:hypothetical protein
MAPKQKPVSLDADDFVGGGIVEDNDVEVVSAKWRCAPKADYREECEADDDGAVPVLDLEVKVLDGDSDEPVHVILSAGNIERVQPAGGGKYLVGKPLSPGCNAGIFLSSLKDAGFDTRSLTNDIGGMDGQAMHFLRIAAPKRTGLPVDPAEEGKGNRRPSTVLTVTELLEKKKGAPKKKAAKPAVEDDDEDEAPAPKKKGAKPVKPSVDEDENDEDEADEDEAPAPKKGKKGAADPTVTDAEKFVAEAIKKAGGSLAVDDVYEAAFKKVKLQEPAQRKKLVALIGDEEWLQDAERPWSEDDGTLSL